MKKHLFVVIMLAIIFSASCKANKNKDFNIIESFDKNAIAYILDNETAYRIIGTKQIRIDGIKIEETFINDWLHYYFILDKDNESRIEQDPIGTYLFNYNGELRDIIPFGTTVESDGIFFSLNGKYIGEDTGTWAIRNMTFYSYPEYEKIGQITYTGKIFWRDDVVLYTSIGDDNIQGSPLDDDYYHFIEEYDLETKEKRMLYNFSALYDVFLHDFVHDTLIISKRYVDNIQDWEEVEKYKYEVVLSKYK